MNHSVPSPASVHLILPLSSTSFPTMAFLTQSHFRSLSLAHIHAHAHIYTHTHTHTHASTHTHAHTCTHAHTHASTRTRAERLSLSRIHLFFFVDQVFFVCFIYSPALPVLLPIAAITLGLQYWADKVHATVLAVPETRALSTVRYHNAVAVTTRLWSRIRQPTCVLCAACCTVLRCVLCCVMFCVHCSVDCCGTTACHRVCPPQRLSSCSDCFL